MAGLIPLMLHSPSGPGSRNSVVYAPSPSTTTNNAQPLSAASFAALKDQHKRMASLDSSAPAKPKAGLRRLSLQAPAALPVLPYTASEWNAAVAEVKRHYINRKYRLCSSRCAEIIDNIKPDAHVEPAYLMYLNFYAASSAEMLARPLSPSSPYRVRLLHQARQSYGRADTLIQEADDSVCRLSRPSSAATTSSSSSSCSGSLHSPSSSISSRTSTEPSFDEPLAPALKPRGHVRAPSKKRVTFCDEPVIRPDSPTLGFDDLALRCPSRQADSGVYVPVTLQPAAAPPRPRHARQSSLRSLAPTPELPVDDLDDDLTFLRARSIHRYSSLLASLRAQIASHLSAIDADLAAADAAPARMSFSLPSRAASPAPVAADGEPRSLDIQARIERLRASGWQRKRFDPRRYEHLREAALAELP